MQFARFEVDSTGRATDRSAESRVARLPRLIRAVRAGTTWLFEIDGETFPWFVSGDGVTVTVDPQGCPGVTLTIPANRVDIIDSLDRLPAVTA